MSRTSYLNGHKIFWRKPINQKEGWYYSDFTIADENNIRPCLKCGKLPNKNGHDACLQNLPGVIFACCGHGVEEGYIKFNDGRIIRGNFEIENV